MKKMMKFSALALIAATALISCAKEESVKDAESAAPVKKTFTLKFAEDDSKVAIDAQGKTKWEVGDEILIHGGSNDREVVTLTADDISTDGKTATITCTAFARYSGSSYKSNLYAIYPASVVTSTNTLYYETRISDFTVPSMGGYDDGESTFTFINLCGVIEFKVSGDFDTFEFLGNSDETVAYYPDYQCRLALKTDDTVDYRRTSSNGAVSVSSKVATGAVVADGTTVNTLCIPEGVNLSTGFTFRFYKGDDLKKIATTDKAVNIAKDKILRLGDISSHLEDYVPPTHSDHKSEITGAKSLADVQANCYVITAAGAYKLPALKGNSEEAAGEVFDVELLWETYNNANDVTANSVIAAVDFEDNWIYFKTPDTLLPGNALIAAKDDKGKILWSWHIWIPSTEIKDVDASAYANDTFMDRNLGALVAADPTAIVVESYGLVYQWGRKDPFPGPKRVDTWPSMAKVAGTAISVEEGLSTGSAHAKPTAYGKSFAPDAGCWAQSKTTKTVNDPCPAGYKIPYAEKDSAPLYNTSSIITAAADYGWEMVKDSHYFKIGTGANISVFPLAGYLDNDINFSHSDDRAAIWVVANTSSYYHLNVRADSGTAAFGSTSANRGCNVRCVVITPAE